MLASYPVDGCMATLGFYIFDGSYIASFKHFLGGKTFMHQNDYSFLFLFDLFSEILSSNGLTEIHAPIVVYSKTKLMIR